MSNLIAINSIASFIWAASGGVLDAATKYGFGDDFRQFADAIVLLGPTDIEDLVVNEFPGSVQHAQDGSYDVPYMHQWTPGRAIALNIDPAGGECGGYEIVQDHIQS